jgi:hypothetical protein
MPIALAGSFVTLTLLAADGHFQAIKIFSLGCSLTRRFPSVR